MKTAQKANGLWQKTKYANLVRNASSGKYFARFRNNGKLIWRSLDTHVLSIAAQRLPDKIKAQEMKRLRETSKRLRLPEREQFKKIVQKIATNGSGHSKPCAELVRFLAYGGFRINESNSSPGPTAISSAGESRYAANLKPG